MIDQTNREVTLRDIIISSLMTRQVVCSSPEDPLIDAATRMRDHQHSCTVVTDTKIPVGIVTERDIVRLFVSKSNEEFVTVGQVMSSPPITVDENTTLFEALVVAKAHKLRHLPVVNVAGELVGIVTQSDLVQAHFQVLETQRELVENSIQSRTQELIKVNEQLRALSLKDPLLDIGNRRAMEVDLNHTHATAKRYQRLYSVVLFDVDNFKLYNDYYGHLAGDYALKKISDHMKETIRQSDRLYRYGGEEILLLLPETNVSGAAILAERLIKSVSKLALPHCKNDLKVMTVSGGISGYVASNSTLTSWQDVIAQADKELYRAKNSGRNRVMCVETES